jgi:DNA polymerase III sliding clamp (beta) subunit (PCNA family)
MENYHHFVFCAGKSIESNQKSIEIAKKVMDHLEFHWAVQNDLVECQYHSTFKIIDTDHNFEIKLENNNLIQLIDDCMSFAVELNRVSNSYVEV